MPNEQPTSRWTAAGYAKPTAAEVSLRWEKSVVAAIIGWLSSAILCFTLAQQVYKQWKTKHSEGVSPWLPS